MIVFFSIAVGILLLSLVLILPALIKKHTGSGEEQKQATIEILRQRLRQLEQQLDDGEIDQQAFEDARADIELQLAGDLNTTDSGGEGKAPGWASIWAGFAVVVFVPVLSGLMYLSLGTPEALTPGGASRANQVSSHSENPSEAQVETMVANLAKRLESNPGDAEGWLMLGRSYMVLGRFQQAADAYQTLGELVGNVPEVLVRRADALAMLQGGAIGGEPLRLVNQALEQNPSHPQSLWMAATAAHQAQDYPLALSYYKRVEPLIDGEARTEVQGMIRSLESQGVVAANPAPEASTPAAQAKAPEVRIEVEVDLSEELKSKASPEDVVFVFARAVEGPPMPLAAVRKQVSDLPFTVTLDDTQAMTPQFKLSQFDQVTVGARVSKTGQPIPKAGDLEGESQALSPTDTDTVALIIDRVVP